VKPENTLKNNQELIMKKYRLKNISCPSCERKIESRLLQFKEVKDFSSNNLMPTLLIEPAHVDKIYAVIKEIEPAAKLEEIKGETKNPDSAGIKNEIIKISAIVLLLIFGLGFKEELHNTPYSFAEYVVFLSAYLLSGWGVLSKAVKNIIHGKIFDENFLMSIATLGAVLIGQLPEAVAVMLFYNIGEFVQGIAVKRSRKSIRSLLEIRPDYANLKINGEIKIVSPEEVKIGESIVIKPGEKIPLDGEVIEGYSFVDTFPLTGEPVPRSVKVNERVFAGTINKSGLITVKVTKLFDESSISKIMELVENASKKKAKTEKFISTFARYYTPLVVTVALAVAFLPPIFFAGQTFSDWIYRALVMLVISCPCALVISIPLGYFGGIGGASRRGILVKGSNYLDALTEVKTVIFDKTGTLTKGVFKVTDIVPKNGFSKDELLNYAAAAESNSNHPIAQAIIEAYGKEINLSSAGKIEEIAGQGVKANLKDGIIIAGNDRLLHSENIAHDNCIVEGTVVHLALNSKYLGYIIISDEIKDDSIQAIKDLKNLGITNTIMLTGDNKFSADAMAKKIGISSSYSELLPEDKVRILEEVMKSSGNGGKVAFVGDGINDAPVIARADVGIAMGGLGSDAAVEAADIVIMEDHPSKVPEAIKVARETRKIVWQNIVFAMLIKGFFIILGGLGIASMWEAVFADMGVALIAILNATRILRG
jgi:Cd2+/Zn2+-exporting ATPase